MCESDNMPCSEDDDSQSGFMSESGQGLSKAELRKTNKPIMEKKRRARINNCLNELKDLLMDAMDKDPARHSKLEKADILELTVKHLQTLQRNQLAAAIASDPTVLHRFKAGFGDCAVEVRRYLSRLANVPTGVRHRLGNHLNHCISGMDHPLIQDIPQLVPDPLRLDDERPSAFHFVKNARLSSPPLSPMSCGSACDSSTELETPPRQTQTYPFPTPPSRSASDQDCSPETQKPTVSSTTISPDTLKKEAAKTFMEPLSIVIDVENYKIGIDASPKRAVDYSIRQKLKRSVVDNVGPESTAPVAQKVIRMEPATERTKHSETFVGPKKLERIVPVTEKLPAFEIRVLDRTPSFPERLSLAEPKMPLPNRLSSFPERKFMTSERPLSMPELKLTVPESIPSVAERPVFERGFLGPVKLPIPGTVISHTAESLAKSSIAKKEEVKVKTEAEVAQRPRSRSPGQGPSGSTDMWRPW